MISYCQSVREQATMKSTRQAIGQRRAHPSRPKGNRLPILLMTKKISMERE